MKVKNFDHDYVKACRRQAREEEIEMYGKPIKHRTIKSSKKTYNRREFKRNFRDE